MEFYREHKFSHMPNWAEFLDRLLLDGCLHHLENLYLAFGFVLWDFGNMLSGQPQNQSTGNLAEKG